jgi:hypothetical protein
MSRPLTGPFLLSESAARCCFLSTLFWPFRGLDIGTNLEGLKSIEILGLVRYENGSFLAFQTFQLWAYFVYFAWDWLALLQGTSVKPTPHSISLAGSVPMAFSPSVSY